MRGPQPFVVGGFLLFRAQNGWWHDWPMRISQLLKWLFIIGLFLGALAVGSSSHADADPVGGGCQMPIGGHGGQPGWWNGCDYQGWGGFGGWGQNPFPSSPWQPGRSGGSSVPHNGPIGDDN